MNPDEFDPEELIFGGADDCAAPAEPTPQPTDLSFRLAPAFLKMLDPKRENWEFRTFDDVVLHDNSRRKDRTLTRVIRGSLRSAMADLKRVNSLGAGVFVTINRTDGKGKKKENVTEVVAVFADTDGGDIEPLLALKPHIAVISSPGHFHVYWLVSDCKLSQFTSIQQAIAVNTVWTEAFMIYPASCAFLDFHITNTNRFPSRSIRITWTRSGHPIRFKK